MLRVVKRTFDADHGNTLLPGDIVDVSLFKHARALEEHGYLGETDATKPTVDPTKPPVKGGLKKKAASTASASAKAKTPARKMKRSALASRPRVFTRKA